jgi:hypothetical protein
LDSKVIGYHISDRLSYFIGYQRNLGIPLFHSSFNTYAMFTALMANYVFAQTVLNDPILSEMWRTLWKINQYTAVMNKLRVFHTREDIITSSDINEFLSEFTLRCDATEEAWSQMKHILE